jgi:hypothetical protein
MKFRLLFIITVVALFTLPFGISAQTTTYEEDTESPRLTLAPSILDLDVKKKQKLSDEIFVYNNNTFPIPVHIEIHDYTLNREGSPVYSYDDTDWSAKSWVQVKPDDFIIEPGKKRTILLNFSIPKYAEAGSHFITIMFQPVMPKNFYTPSSTHLIPYIGAVVALNVDVKNSKLNSDFLDIEDLTASKSLLAQNKLVELDATIMNKDAFFHKVERQILIKNVFGRVVSTIPLGNTTLYPQKDRILTDSIKGDFGIGVFTAKYSFYEGDYSISMNKTMWILPPIWIIVIVFLGVLVVFFTLINPKRMHDALKIILKGERRIETKSRRE